MKREPYVTLKILQFLTVSFFTPLFLSVIHEALKNTNLWERYRNRNRRNENRKINNVKYLGTIVTKNNLIEEEIKERIATGNRVFFANKKIFQSKLISKKSKIKLYKALIRPVVVYGSECWNLTENIK
jgi:hypothetical protein